MKRRGVIGALLPAPPLFTGVLTELSYRYQWHEPMLGLMPPLLLLLTAVSGLNGDAL
jgi:hypothetical protein